MFVHIARDERVRASGHGEMQRGEWPRALAGTKVELADGDGVSIWTLGCTAADRAGYAAHIRCINTRRIITAR